VGKGRAGLTATAADYCVKSARTGLPCGAVSTQGAARYDEDSPMTRIAALALAAATALTSPAVAQSLAGGRELSVDAGLGVKYSPEFMGSDNLDSSPWIILRNGDSDAGKAQGISILPSLNYLGKRDASDHPDL